MAAARRSSGSPAPPRHARAGRPVRRSRAVRAPEPAPVDIAPTDPLLALLESESGIVDIETLELDSPAVRELKAAGVKLVVPLISQGELIGVLNLGPRRSEQEYSSDDRKLLEQPRHPGGSRPAGRPARARAGGRGRDTPALRAGARGRAPDPAALPAQGAARPARAGRSPPTTSRRARSAATSTT